MLSGPSFRSTFVFNINSSILSGFSLTCFHLADASLSAFSRLYTLVCAVFQQYHEMPFIYNDSQFSAPVNAHFSAKTKPSHVTFKLTTRSAVQIVAQTMQ